MSECRCKFSILLFFLLRQFVNHFLNSVDVIHFTFQTDWLTCIGRREEMKCWAFPMNGVNTFQFSEQRLQFQKLTMIAVDIAMVLLFNVCWDWMPSCGHQLWKLSQKKCNQQKDRTKITVELKIYLLCWMFCQGLGTHQME